VGKPCTVCPPLYGAFQVKRFFSLRLFFFPRFFCWLAVSRVTPRPFLPVASRRPLVRGGAAGQCDWTEHPGQRAVVGFTQTVSAGVRASCCIDRSHPLEHNWPRWGGGHGVDTADRIRGELACRGGAVSIRSNLVFGTTSREVGNHDAVMRIGGEAPKGRPILHERHKRHGWVRDTATSDRHRQPLARSEGAPNRIISPVYMP
jgi:hypothetical protein